LPAFSGPREDREDFLRVFSFPGFFATVGVSGAAGVEVAPRETGFSWEALSLTAFVAAVVSGDVIVA
jgi:hypothetical protein